MTGAGSPKAAREPRPEGYVVARIAGEEEVRRAPHVLVEEGLAHQDLGSGAGEGLRNAAGGGRSLEQSSFARSAWKENGAKGEVSESEAAGSEAEGSKAAGPKTAGPKAAVPDAAPAEAAAVEPEARAPEAPQAAEQAQARETAQQPPPWDEGLGELPWAYQDDTFLALPRDPRTLWLLWDFAPGTIDEARRGLHDPRVRLRLFDEGGPVREFDLALESGSFYLNDLPPGRTYRAELLVVGSNGEHRIGRAANQVGLPPSGPSPIVDDRFATLPWGLPLGRELDLFTHGVSLAGISESERAALLAASRPGERLGGSESLGGGSQSAKAWLSSRDR